MGEENQGRSQHNNNSLDCNVTQLSFLPNNLQTCVGACCFEGSTVLLDLINSLVRKGVIPSNTDTLMHDRCPALKSKFIVLG